MGRIDIAEGDITTQKVDAIVNAANSSLLGGGGVDGAIHRAAGPELLAACRELRASTLPEGLPPGDAVATPGFKLKAKWVVHTVGPNRRAGQTDPAVLRRCFANSLAVARGLRARSIAFPAIGAGVYGWDVTEVAAIAMDVALGHIAERDTLDRIRFVTFGAEATRAFEEALGQRR
ncbi:O-acetyl-ADP-ribose deacetylase [Nostocoides sp.]